MSSSGSSATGLYTIIVFKFVKGIFFLSLAFGLYSLVDNDLPEDFRKLVHQLHLDPEHRFFRDLEVQITRITPTELIKVASGTVLYSVLTLAEAVGLVFRRPWAGWLALGESAFFIPIEIYELSHRFRVIVLIILIINTFIVCYLYRNRSRLFHHPMRHDGGDKD
jgi:uncharacterized membrane protein (DUF2068 family)